MTYHLPDVSEWQTNVDWKAVRDENGGSAIVRAMYGSSHIDNLWLQGRREAAHTAGINLLGIYQYLRSGQDALVQARTFATLVGSLRRGEFAILDLEEGSGDQSGRAHIWLDHVNSKLNYRGYHGAWLYSGHYFAIDHGLAPIFNGPEVHTWVASYGRTESSLGHSLWQHSDGTIARCEHHPWPGAGYVDCNQRPGNKDDLQNIIYSATTDPRPEPKPEPEPTIQEEVMLISREEFDRNDGAVPIALATGQDHLRFYSNHPAHLRVDLRNGNDEFDLTYDSAHAVDAPSNAVVVHRTDTGGNDISVAIW